ncbi:hypothetical protein [Paracoccus tegillarcae]|uniref:Uncharacterized protein n=1 Tax=Paracoccus tegillarcae TaxID=1529068 RepID=A0A2K9F0W4_9RHOB|nr:hypothetical protein [Paracoccus tegillarcae]AUH34012.1 hypothetical protein CUV01_11965 [Paracoccus tegillarcae]
MRLIKLLVVLVLAAVIALVGYAYLGDMDPSQREIRDPIPVEGGELAPNPVEAEDGATDAAATGEDAPEPETESAPETETEPETETAPAPISDEDTTEAPGD